MLLRRSIMLSLIALSTFLAIAPLPAKAEEGEFIAQDVKAQINVRALANTEADIVGAGVVGDRVQILGHSNGNDGLRWYRIKLLKSGQLGWVRGDLIRVFSSPQATTAPASVPLSPPRLAASAKSSAPVKATTPAKPTAPVSPTPAKPEAPQSATTAPIAPPEKVAAPASNSAAITEATTIVAFQTPTYAVRIFSEAGQLRLNLFNRKRSRLALKAVPVESKNSGKETTYRYGSDWKVIVSVPLNGQPTLTTDVLGETVQEQPEAPLSPAASP